MGVAMSVQEATRTAERMDKIVGVAWIPENITAGEQGEAATVNTAVGLPMHFVMGGVLEHLEQEASDLMQQLEDNLQQLKELHLISSQILLNQ